MVLGIVGIVIALCFWPVGLICALVGLPLGGVNLARTSNGHVAGDGRGEAIAGVVLCIITIVLSIAAIAWLASVWNDA